MSEIYYSNDDSNNYDALLELLIDVYLTNDKSDEGANNNE